MYKKEEVYDSKIIDSLKDKYKVIIEEIGEDPNREVQLFLHQQPHELPRGRPPQEEADDGAGQT